MNQCCADYFGPVLLEAMMKTLLAELNELKKAAGKPEFSFEDFMTECAGKVATINSESV